MTTVVLFWICIVPCLWLNTASHREFAPDLSFPQQSHQSLHLPSTHRKKRPYMLSHPMVSAIFLERPEGLKIKKQIVFGNVCCLFSSFQKSENHISQTTTPNIWKGLKKHWNPKMMISNRHLHFCPFSGSIFILGGESRFFQQKSAGCLHPFPFGGQESRLRRMRLGFWMNTGLAVGPRRERRRCGTFPENVKSGAFGRLKSHLVSD